MLYKSIYHLFSSTVRDEEPPVESVVVVDALAEAEHVEVSGGL